MCGAPSLSQPPCWKAANPIIQARKQFHTSALQLLPPLVMLRRFSVVLRSLPWSLPAKPKSHTARGRPTNSRLQPNTLGKKAQQLEGQFAQGEVLAQQINRPHRSSKTRSAPEFISSKGGSAFRGAKYAAGLASDSPPACSTRRAITSLASAIPGPESATSRSQTSRRSVS